MTLPVPEVDDQPAVARVPPRRPRWWWIVAAVLVVAVLVGSGVWFTRSSGDDPAAGTGQAAGSSPETRPAVTTKVGVFRGTDVREVVAYEMWLGRDVDYVVDFSSRATWAEISQPQYQIDTWKGTGYRMVYSLAMLPDDPADTMARGANGDYDQYFAELARRLVAGDQADAILRLGWEFNLVDSRWSTDDPAVFIAYWRHVVAAMRAVPGAKFEFDWNPNNGKAKYDAAEYYPGDDVVDHVGVDAYDNAYTENTYPYPDGCDANCRTQRQKNAWDQSIYGGARGLKFWSRFAADHGKPLSLPEWGIWIREDGHGGGENVDYLRRMQAFIADPANRVAYQSYFEVDGHDGPHRLMTTFPAAGEVFRSLFGPTAP